MPSRQLLIYFGVGLAAIALLLGGTLYLTRGSHIELKGSIQKVRMQGFEDKSTVVVVDFRFVNPSNYPFVVRAVTVTIEDADGKTFEGTPVAEVDARRLFDYYPLLGLKYNDSLVVRSKIAPRESLDRMIAARFEVPEERIKARKGLKLRIEDVDGPMSEIEEAK